MARYQYRIIDLGAFWQRDRLVRTLATLGSTGWELIAIYDKSSNWLQGLEKGFALFKRAVADGEEPDGAWAEAGWAKGADGTEALESAETECLSCGAVMPADGDTCSVCGWSYSTPESPTVESPN